MRRYLCNVIEAHAVPIPSDSALALFAGQLHRLSDVTLIRALRVEIDGPSGEPVQVDGDLDGQLPVTIDIDDRVLRLAVPADGARRGARLATAAS